MKKSSKEKWFKGAVEEKAPYNLGGWNKDASETQRHKEAMDSRPKNWSDHKKYLSIARALQALANVNTDAETKKIAKRDADYFFEKAKEENKKRKGNKKLGGEAQTDGYADIEIYDGHEAPYYRAGTNDSETYRAFKRGETFKNVYITKSDDEEVDVVFENKDLGVLNAGDVKITWHKKETGGYMKEGGLTDKARSFFKKAKDYSKKAYQSAKPHMKSAYEKSKEATKSAYKKTKEYTEEKIHDQKKKIALQVLDETKDKVIDDKKAYTFVKNSEQIIESEYAKGAKVKSKSSNNDDDKFELVYDGGDRKYFMRDFGKVSYDDKENIKLLVIADIQDLTDAVSEEEIKEMSGGKPIMLSFTLIPEEKYISKEHISEANDESSSISDNILVNVVNYMGGLNYEPADKEHSFYDNMKDAEKYLQSKELNDKISAMGVMSGFTMDKYYNRIGQTNWDRLSYIIGEAKRFKTGGFVSKGERVWNKLTSSKRAEFLYENFTPEITPRSQEILVDKAYNFLPKNVKIKIEAKYANVEEGEYENGGSTATGGGSIKYGGEVKIGEFIYILSDGEVKEGDFDYSINYKTITKADKQREEYLKLPTVKPLYKKVVATNDPKLLKEGISKISSGGSIATGAKTPKSTQVKKIANQISALKQSLDSPVTAQFPELKEKTQKKIDELQKLHDEMSIKVATKEKMDLERGTFYIEIPTSRKNELYLKLRDNGIKAKWKSMGDATRAVVDKKSKQAKVYELYSEILQRENQPVPSMETISGKLAR